MIAYVISKKGIDVERLNSGYSDVEELTPMRCLPSYNAKVVVYLNDGEELELLDFHGASGYYAVCTKSGKEGYVYKDDIITKSEIKEEN